MEQLSFFNTTNETGNRLANANANAKSQQQIIEQLYKKQRRPLSASQVLNILNLNGPITSIRRSITNLKTAGILEKTQNKINGMYGKPEYQYQVSE